MKPLLHFVPSASDESSDLRKAGIAEDTGIRDGAPNRGAVVPRG
jgi:hypothetical protein